MRVEELDRPPRLGPLYLAAAARRGGVRDTLPERELVLRDVAVDPERLSAYDRVCGFRLRDEVPATYPHVMAFPLAMSLMAAPDFPMPLLGLVHVANRIDQLRPVRITDQLDFRVRAEDLRPHERGTQVDVVATASVGDEPVWLSRSTYLRRHGGGSTSAGERPQPPPANATWRIERRVGPDYAAVSGDRNPIHTSRLLARAFGFPRPIAHGMWSKARCLAALEGRLPDAYTVRVEFKLPILLPAKVDFSASAVDGDWTFKLHDTRSGKPHLVGTVSRSGRAADPGPSAPPGRAHA